jgi:hypothetical protein
MKSRYFALFNFKTLKPLAECWILVCLILIYLTLHSLLFIYVSGKMIMNVEFGRICTKTNILCPILRTNCKVYMEKPKKIIQKRRILDQYSDPVLSEY